MAETNVDEYSVVMTGSVSRIPELEIKLYSRATIRNQLFESIPEW